MCSTVPHATDNPEPEPPRKQLQCGHIRWPRDPEALPAPASARVTKNEVTKNEVTKNEVTKNEVTKNEVSEGSA
jgi:hypothetical protein